MVYVIENEKHQQVGATLNTLSVITRPDGGLSTNVKVDSEIYDENGDGPYYVREVIEERSGSGTMKAEIEGPTYAGGKWKRITKYVEKPTPVDAQGSDKDADGYDPNYAERYSSHREQAYNAEGVTIDAMIIALFEKVVEERDDAADALQVLRLAVKKRFPKPE